MHLRGIQRLLVTLCLFTAFRAGLAYADYSALCRTAVASVESSRRIPDAFLSAIARVESGRPDPATGVLAPWPWTINAEGKGTFFQTEAEAIAAVRALQAKGVRSIDVGCMQVNLMHHPEAFASLDQAFEPSSNAAFAGQLLESLFSRTGSWPLAAAAYHSQTPTIGAAYQERVLAEWAVPEGSGAAKSPSGPSSPLRSRVSSQMPDSRVADISSSAGAVPSFAGTAMGRSAAFTSRSAPIVAGIAATGRSLAAYRAMPTALAFRMPPRPG